MNRAMEVAASGMAAEQAALETVTENLANADVTAFKQALTNVRPFGAQDAGLGVSVEGKRLVLTQGKLVASGGPCDLAIRGEGFFAVQRGNELAFTRDGAFVRNAAGQLCNSDGWHLPGLHIAANVEQLKVEPDGHVAVKTAQGTATIGRIRLALFAAPEQLHALTPTLFEATAASGAATYLAPNVERGPSIAFGMLEHANVSIVDAMMEIMQTQRAYEADAKGVQAADDMTRIANNLEHGS